MFAEIALGIISRVGLELDVGTGTSICSGVMRLIALKSSFLACIKELNAV